MPAAAGEAPSAAGGEAPSAAGGEAPSNPAPGMVDYITVMSPRHVVVDGSNIATEGRNLPSLAQLDQAVREYLAENPDDIVTVVVDASFGHRIDGSELPSFEEAEAAAEVVSPPAGAIGRGDAFLLRIAEKTGAMVLSNDSFQEFHREHEWLFDKGRLIGGKPVPGVGWIFTPRTPVRGPKSREAVKEAKRRRKAPEMAEGMSGLDLAASRKGRGKKVEKAIATATDEATGSGEGGRRRRRRGGEPPSEPVNAPLAFINFIAAHRPGSRVEGTVESFSSHGAFVTADGATCYLPLSAMADPAPKRAREVVQKGETRSFVVQAFDPQRRGVELAVPGFERLSAGVTEETVEAEIDSGRPGPAPSPPRKRRSPARMSQEVAPEPGGPEVAPEPVRPEAMPEASVPVEVAPAKAPRRAPARKAAAGAPVEPVTPAGDAAPRPSRSRQAVAPAGDAAPRSSRSRKAAAPEMAEPSGAQFAPVPGEPAGAETVEPAAKASRRAPARKEPTPAMEAAAKPTRSRKAAAAVEPAVEVAPKPTRSRKAVSGGDVAAAVGEVPEGAPGIAMKPTRSRKASATEATSAPEAAPKVRRRRAGGEGQAAHAEPAAAEQAAAAPVRRPSSSRRSAAAAAEGRSRTTGRAGSVAET